MKEGNSVGMERRSEWRRKKNAMGSTVEAASESQWNGNGKGKGNGMFLLF